MSTTTIQTIQETISTEKEWIIHLRRHFHQYPEASLKEYETIKRIKEELLALAIPFVEVGETGVLATIEGGLGAGKTFYYVQILMRWNYQMQQVLPMLLKIQDSIMLVDTMVMRQHC